MRVIKCNGFPIPKRLEVITIGTQIFIRPNAPAHVLAHEKVHVKQFKTRPFTFLLRYLFSDKWLLNYEAEAYAVGVANGMSIAVAASFLAYNYSLSITAEKAQKEIEKWMVG